MITRLPAHYGDDTCSAYVRAGDFLFLAHHGGGYEKDDVAYQMKVAFDVLEETLAAAGATFDDMVQIHLYLKHTKDFEAAREVFYSYFKQGFPVRMSSTTEFLSPACLCMVDGIAYKQRD